MVVGVLALQGDFEAHRKALADLGASSLPVRTPDHLRQADGLIIPGGESTTMLKLIHEEGLAGPLAEFAKTKPIFGTCAGAILMARKVTSPAQESFNLMDIEVERNAYGRQLDSSIRRLEPEEAFLSRTEPGALEAVFIRAPIIRGTGPGVEVLIRDGELPVLVEQGRHLAGCFHPELTSDRRVHGLFLKKVGEESG